MSNLYLKKIRRKISLICLLAVCLCHTTVSGADEPSKWQLGPLVFRVWESEDAVSYLVVSTYNQDQDSTGDIFIHPSYKDINGKVRKVGGVDARVFKEKTLCSLRMVCDPEVVKYTIGASAFRDAKIGRPESGETTDCCVIECGEDTYIGDSAFEGAQIRGNVEVSMKGGTIGVSAFKNMEADGTVTISGEVDTIGKEAFFGMKGNDFSLPKSISHIEDRAFAESSVHECDFSGIRDLKTIGSGIFENCMLLKKIILPEGDSVQEVAADAFPDKEGLTIVIPEGVADLTVFHIENYKNVVFQTSENLTEDSPVLQYLKESKLKYQVGENGEVMLPGQPPAATPEPTPAGTPEPTPTGTPEPKPAGTPEPTPAATPEPTPTATPESTPTATPEPTPTGTLEPTPAETPEAMPTMTPDPTPGATLSASSAPVSTDKSEEQPGAAQSPAPEPVTTPVRTPDLKGKTLEQPVNKKIWVVKKIKYRITGKSQVAVTGTVSKHIKKLEIPDMVMIKGRLYKVVKIGKRAFKGQTKMKTAVVGNYVGQVGDEAFAGCRGLTSIQFGTRVSKIGSKVLYRDMSLKKIIFKGKWLTYIGRQTLSGVSRKVDIRAKKVMVKKYAKLINGAK